MTAPFAALLAHLDALVENRDSDADDIICTAGEMALLLRRLDRAEAAIAATTSLVCLGPHLNPNTPHTLGCRCACTICQRRDDALAAYRAEGAG